MHFVPRPTQSLSLASWPFKPIFRSGGKRLPGALASRIQGFVVALQARYGERAGRFRSQGLVFRQATLGRFVSCIYQPVQLTLSPRLQLSFQTSSPQHFRLPADNTALPTLPVFPTPALKPAGISVWRSEVVSPREGEYHPLEIRQVVQETSRLAIQIPTQMVRRLAARLERVETVRYLTQAAPPQGSQAFSGSPHFNQLLSKALPVPQVTLNRMQSIRLEESQSSDQRINGMRKQINPVRFAEFPSHPPSDMNINQLADQVVHVINDRVTARQERYGRI